MPTIPRWTSMNSGMLGLPRFGMREPYRRSPDPATASSIGGTRTSSGGRPAWSGDVPSPSGEGGRHPRKEAKLSTGTLKVPVGHPALRRHSAERAQSFQNRLADAITTFAGSMTFVYVHV